MFTELRQNCAAELRAENCAPRIARACASALSRPAPPKMTILSPIVEAVWPSRWHGASPEVDGCVHAIASTDVSRTWRSLRYTELCSSSTHVPAKTKTRRPTTDAVWPSRSIGGVPDHTGRAHEKLETSSTCRSFM